MTDRMQRQGRSVQGYQVSQNAQLDTLQTSREMLGRREGIQNVRTRKGGSGKGRKKEWQGNQTSQND